ncbi:MAG TPA: type IV pilus secretin PilQ [Rhodanobacteraceae bacterium]
MPTKTTHLRCRALIGGLIVAAGMAFAGTALATTTLQQISHQTLPGGRVQLTLHFAGGPVPQPKIFSTSSPANIAVDLDDTTNAVAKRHIPLNIGATTGVTVVSADGRTRMIVGLLRPASYSSKVTGDTLVMTIANGEGTATGTYAATIDPTKSLPATAGTAQVSRIGFRRGQDGQGRVIVHYTGTGLQSRITQNDGMVDVHLDGVSVPAKLAQRLDVMDFATPVRTIDTKVGRSGGATLQLAVAGNVVTSSYKSGGKLVIEVARKPKAKDSDIIGAEKKKVYTGKPATFDFQNIPVRAVLQIIAEQSHLNIVAADSVQGSVTLHLVNVPWDQALDVVLRAKGLAKRQNGNVIWIAPQQQLAQYEQRMAEARIKAANNAPLVAAYIPISYGNAGDIAKLLTSGAKSSGGGGGTGVNGGRRGFLSPRGSVSFDARTNTLLVNDTAEKVTEIKNLVAKLDRPVKQVLIQARIVAATNDFARSLGVKWGAMGLKHNNNNTIAFAPNAGSGAGNIIDNLSNNGPTGLVSGNGSGTSTSTEGQGFNVNLPITNPAGTAALAILGKNYLVDLELQAAQSEGRTEIISSPRVITANHMPADIQQGQQIGYVTVQGGTAGGLGTATVQFKNAVLELHVTPTITADKRIFMKIDVKKDALDKFVNNPGGGQVPLLDHRSLTTSVLVDNGQTVVLGGIYEINKSDTTAKVPGLGDIPILGALFRTKSKSNSKAELLIFVTPRILTETGN